MEEPGIIIKLSEYNRLAAIDKSLKENRIYINHTSFFTGGPGGITKHGIEIYNLKDSCEKRILLDFETKQKELDEEIHKLRNENYQLKSKLQNKKKWL